MRSRYSPFFYLLRSGMYHSLGKNSDIMVLNKYQYAAVFSTTDNGQKRDSPDEPPKVKEFFDEVELPEEPTNCCMSGCANCVWIEYAKELKKIFFDSDEKVREIILKKIEDPSMRVFLEMELKLMEKS